MIRALYRRVAESVSTTACLRKYNGIWGLKEHLARSETPDAQLLAIYDAYFGGYGSWIGYNSELENVPCFPHGPYGVFISGGARIGRNAVVFQQVTIGSDNLIDSKKPGSPTLGDNVYIGAGAKIIGSVVIGDNCRIGANAVVYQDMPPNSVAVQSPTRIIQKSDLDNRHYSRTREGLWVYFRDGKWIEANEGQGDALPPHLQSGA